MNLRARIVVFVSAYWNWRNPINPAAVVRVKKLDLSFGEMITLHDSGGLVHLTYELRPWGFRLRKDLTYPNRATRA